MKVKLEGVRLAFVNLDQPRSFTGTDGSTSDPRFSLAAIFEHGSEAAKKLAAAEVAVAKEKWGEKAGPIYKSLKASGKLALRDGDGKASYDGFEGNLYIQASSKVRPLVIDGNRAPIPPGVGTVYSGCYANLVLDVWAQDNQWGKRINCNALGVQFVKDGERFSQVATASEDDFEPVPGAESTAASIFDDPASGIDESDPFG